MHYSCSSMVIVEQFSVFCFVLWQGPLRPQTCGLPPSSSQVLGLWMCTTTHVLLASFLVKISVKHTVKDVKLVKLYLKLSRNVQRNGRQWSSKLTPNKTKTIREKQATTAKQKKNHSDHKYFQNNSSLVCKENSLNWQQMKIKRWNKLPHQAQTEGSFFLVKVLFCFHYFFQLIFFFITWG
jgi:hypothetical protein